MSPNSRRRSPKCRRWCRRFANSQVTAMATIADCPIIEDLAEPANSFQRVGPPTVARETPSFGIDTPASSRVREATVSRK